NWRKRLFFFVPVVSMKRVCGGDVGRAYWEGLCVCECLVSCSGTLLCQGHVFWIQWTHKHTHTPRDGGHSTEPHHTNTHTHAHTHVAVYSVHQVGYVRRLFS